MGYFTSFFIKPDKVPLLQAYNGSFVMDNSGQIISSTLSSALPAPQIKAIAEAVVALFQSASDLRICMNEIVANYMQLELRATRFNLRTHVYLKAKGCLDQPEFI